MTDTPETSEPLKANYYVVALGEGEARSYLICRPFVELAAGEGWGGLSAREIADYIKLHQVPAAPLPGSPIEHAMDLRTGPGFPK
jgi:hypothetical protein